MRFCRVIVSGREISTTAGSPFAHISSSISSAGSNRSLVIKNSVYVRSFGRFGADGTASDMARLNLSQPWTTASRIALVRFFSQGKGDRIVSPRLVAAAASADHSRLLGLVVFFRTRPLVPASVAKAKLS